MTFRLELFIDYLRADHRSRLRCSKRRRLIVGLESVVWCFGSLNRMNVKVDRQNLRPGGLVASNLVNDAHALGLNLHSNWSCLNWSPSYRFGALQ